VLLGGDHQVLFVRVAYKDWVVACRKGNAFTAASTWTHTLAIVGVTILTATPRSLDTSQWQAETEQTSDLQY